MTIPLTLKEKAFVLADEGGEWAFTNPQAASEFENYLKAAGFDTETIERQWDFLVKWHRPKQLNNSKGIGK
jgi:hypothetical protein